MAIMDCPALNVPHLQYLPSSSPMRKRKASVSFLLVGGVLIPTQQRYLISFQSDVQHLKPTDTSSPFLSPFSRHILILCIINSAVIPTWLRDYPSSSC